MAIDPNNLSATAVMTFDDEFNTLNLFNGTSGTWDTKYAFQGASGGGLPGEQEWYINSLYSPTSAVKPWTVSNGVLTITAAPADPSIQPLINNSQYTSGIITTFHSFSQTYGYFEIRAELPKGQGFWPAFWLLPADQTWPPEIDVFEVLGKDTSTLYTTVHTNSTGTHTQSGIGTQVADTSVGFHTYGVDWESDYITWYYDGRQVYKTATPADLVNKPMYMLANLGLGGSWGGPVDSTTPWPAQFQIDYIRAYSAGPAGGTSTPPPPTPPTTPPPTTGGGSGQVLTANDSTTPLIGGPGNDTLIAGRGGANLTGGGGADIFQFKAIPWSAGHITDFTPGVDKLDLSALFTAANYHGSNPVADGYLSFVSDGAGGTRVMLDTDGYGSANPWPFLITTLDNVPMSSLQPSDWIYSTTSGSTPPSSTPSTPSPPPTTPPPTTSSGSGQVLTANDSTTPLIGGAGNDTLIAGRGAANLTGGGGADIFQFKSIPWSAGHITDFTPGVDKLDLSALFTVANYHGSNPVADGYLSFVSDGAGGTRVMLDTDGYGSANPWPFLITTLDNVPMSSLQPSDWIYSTTSGSTPPSSTPSTPSTPPTTPPPTTGGGTAGVVLTATDGGSVLTGGAGNDTLIAGHGADTLTGGAGSDTFQFNYLPWSAGHITDFTSGVDKIDLSPLFTASNYQGSDPVGDGYLNFVSDGAGGTKIMFDPDGFGAANPWPFLITDVQNVSNLQPTDWIYKAGTTGASSGAGGTASSGGAVPGVVLTGNDFGATLVGGAGSDTLIAGHGAFTMTGGGGSDTFQFNVLPWSAGHITDFTPGVDHLDFHSLFAASGYTGSDPIRDGYLSFATDAAGGTKIYFDPDGFGSANPWPTLMTTLDHVSLNNPMDWFLH